MVAGGGWTGISQKTTCDSFQDDKGHEEEGPGFSSLIFEDLVLFSRIYI